MSDSEDSFESADEGESQTKKFSGKDDSNVNANYESESQKNSQTDAENAGNDDENNSQTDVENVDKDSDSKISETEGNSNELSQDTKEKVAAEHTTSPHSVKCAEIKTANENLEIEEPKSKEENMQKEVSVSAQTDKTNKAEALTNTEPPAAVEVSKNKEQQSPKNALDKLADTSNKSGWGWGGWGSSLLQTASDSVNTFTSSVGEGFSTVLETVESSLGAPDPSELASQQAEDEKVEMKDQTTSEQPKPPSETVDPDTGPASQDIDRQAGSQEGPIENVDEDVKSADNDQSSSGWFSGFGVSSLSGVVKQTVQQTSSLVQEKSKGLVHGSLDVLETLGKKTFDVLAEGDHGLKKTLEKAKQKPNLSVLLREAAAEAAETAKLEEEFVESQKSHFGAQFDEFQGLVQLEALEMLSNQCEGKLHSLLAAMSTEQVATVKKQLVSIKEAFELDEQEQEEDEESDHNFADLVTEYTGKLGLNVTAEKLIQVQEKIRNRVSSSAESSSEEEKDNVKMMHQIAIQSLAELTAKTVGHFHRIGQLLVIDPKGPITAYKDKADAIASLTKCVCFEVGVLSSKSTQALTSAADSSSETEDVNSLITSVYLEATNSSTYLHDAMQLLLPVVQQAAVECT